MTTGSSDTSSADSGRRLSPARREPDLPSAAAAPVDISHSRRTEPLDAGVAVIPETCPVCGAPRIAVGRFCEGCGVDVSTPTALPTAWVAEISVDRQLFDRVAADGATFPAGRPAVTVPIAADEVTIGRGRSTGPVPDIDLSGALADPAVSHQHATLVRSGSNTYEVVDLGSTNGTTVNDDPTPLVPSVATTLADGDRIHVGAWTTITIRLAGPT